ncbi:AAA domain-containing protein [Shumkonia mesophila]|uniref:AAA domain-containing protein n=1 Tax=Shumkonia mesophila TaxID=2838854 RepID=UPI00293501A3|nr:AAA domain-containing protein [Shumkonia mesophila]
MPLPLKSLLRYWRAALLDSNRHIEPYSLNLCPCRREHLAAGRLDKEALAEIWQDAEEGLPKEKRDELQFISVLVAPQVLESEHEHAERYATIKRTRVPLWVFARADRAGVLHPVGAPIVDRAVQAPLRSGSQTFTTVEAVDKYLNTNPSPGEDSDWGAFWGHAMTMFADLFGGSLGNWTPERYVDRGTFVAYGLPPIDASRPIREIYEILSDAEEDSPPTLLARLADPQPPREVTTSQDCPAALASRHLGQIGGEFPLNANQRQALGAMLAAKNGEILALNGPPGTGKTTFIQSVVASLWVENALAEDGEPPVILASSTNNKAITNILDTFARATLPEDHPLAGSPLVQRWLPDFGQYGLFLPSTSETKKGIKKEYAAAWCPQNGQPWSGLPGTVETQDYVAKAEPFWQTQFATWTGHASGTIAEAVETVRNTLAAKVEAMAAIALHRTALLTTLPTGTPPTPATMDTLRAEIADGQSRLDALCHHGHEALRRIEGSLIESLLSWFKPIRRRLWTRAYEYLDSKGLADPEWGWDTVLDATAFRRWLAENTRRSEAAVTAKTRIVANWDSWVSKLAAILPDLVPDDVWKDYQRVDDALDTRVRPELFHLAGRYWEGRWLMEMTEALQRNDKTFKGRSRDMCERRWRRFAKLTPCLVATAFTAPRLFDYYDGDTKRLFDFIDLLIVDEAGQMPPQVGAALFAFARKALVVGDVMQLEPVWGIDADTDGGNLVSYGMDDDREVMKRGMLASEGSVMALAQSATAFTAAPHRGLFLNEHWRCRSSIIAYCNELAYRDALKPMRSDGEYPWPALGYAHVPGRASSSDLSRVNADEAGVVAKWLARRRSELIQHYEKQEEKRNVRKLGEVVAIVTPFRAQIKELRDALGAAGLGDENITVGTVHTLQGAEKDVVLFSPVYDAGHTGGLFFDRNISMLNVAVSRARESFLVFGNLRLFNPGQTSLPSGLLGRYLFATPENEITDIDPISPIALMAPSELERLDTLDGHCAKLREAITGARERLLIVSPFLSDVAINADNLVPLLASRKGGPRIVVAYDKYLNIGRDQRPLPHASLAIEALVGATGVELWELEGIHNKTLAVDESWIVEGSFNWLSAKRDRGSAYQRHEVSFLYRGKDAPMHVDNAWREIESLRKK